MALRISGIVLLLLSTGATPLLAQQSATTEVDVTVGHSTEHVQTAASQARVFGDAGAGWLYYLEGSWAQTWGAESDAFGSAYPYDKRLHAMELYLEKTTAFRSYLMGVRLGRYRTPFGLGGRSDQAYVGFLRAPLIRYGDYWALSNTALEGGASAIAGVPNLFAEASLGLPQDEGEGARRRGLDRVLRVQGTVGSLIVGASHIRTLPSKSRTFARGETVFSGVDARWMYQGVQVRGEWLRGRPFDGTRTVGGYLDLLVHRPMMGPVTAVFRAERQDYLAGPFSAYPRRYTAGAKIRLSNTLVGHVNLLREHGQRGRPATSAFDVALTFTTRR